MAGPLAERVLGRRELNRALLARQLLLCRSRLSVPRALERIGGIQAQYAPSMYVGLWSRLEDLERAALTRALERRTVVQGTLMRATIHLVSARDYRPFARAIAPGRRAWLLRAREGAATAAEMEGAACRLRAALAERPLRRTEVEALLGKAVARDVGIWLDLVRVPPSGTWERRRADLYGPADDWLGPAPAVAPVEALRHLVESYLRGFGPASAKDVASFAGLNVREVRPALDALTLRRFRSEGGDELLDLPRAPLPDPDTPAPVRFLPTWDATLLVHARRTGILPEEFRPLVFSTKTPQSVGTVLVDGAVAATWRVEAGRLRVQELRRLDAAARRELRDEAERLEAFHA